jgi:hypothetical protein
MPEDAREVVAAARRCLAVSCCKHAKARVCRAHRLGGRGGLERSNGSGLPVKMAPIWPSFCSTKVLFCRGAPNDIDRNCPLLWQMNAGMCRW